MDQDLKDLEAREDAESVREDVASIFGEQHAKEFSEYLFNMAVSMNRAVAEQLELPEHKRDGYAERMYEQADMRRKEIKETHYAEWLKENNAFLCRIMAKQENGNA